MSAAAILRAKQIRVDLGGREILAGVSLHVDAGEIVGLLGPNGAGKTTLMRVLSGQLRPEAGEVELLGRGVTSLGPSRRSLLGLGHLFQTTSVFNGLSAEDNIRGALELRSGRNSEERRTRTDELLQLFDLDTVRRQKGGSLSGGERRRLELARLLATEPRVVLMDEPFAGLDPRAIADVQAEIESLAASGVGVLICDHRVEQTLTICPRACILVAGKIVATGTPAEVREHPAARGAFFGLSGDAIARSNQWA